MKSGDSAKLAAVILAAGEGKRFGGPKALAILGSETFLEIIARNLRETVSEIVVVGGASFERTKKECQRLGLNAVFNPDWPKGQFTSLKAGLAAIADKVAGYFVVLVDHPLVNAETYQMLHDAFMQFPASIILPTYYGRRGHPLIIPDSLAEEILNSPDALSLRNIIEKHAALICEIPVNDAGIRRDIDTAHDLEEATG
jgi:CTP:molybdopterin cytidylyltransferase MocA